MRPTFLRAIKFISVSISILILIQVKADVAQMAQTVTLRGTFETFIEDFNDQTVQEPWFWIREDSSAWSLTEREGYLRIYTQRGTLDQDYKINNLLLRPSQSESFELSTKIEFSPTENFHEASLYLYSNDDNWVKLSRLYQGADLSGDVYLMLIEQDGVIDSIHYSSASESVTELKLVVSVEEDVISGYYKNDDREWIHIGEILVDNPKQFTNIGIAGYHGGNTRPQSIPIDFDFVTLEAITPPQNTETSIFMPFVFR